MRQYLRETFIDCGVKMKLIDIQVAAQKLSVSPSTIRRMIKDPDCPLEGVNVSRRVLVVADSIDACIQRIPKHSSQQKYAPTAP